MIKASIAIVAWLGLSGSAQAHQIWIEQADGQNAVIRFGEFGENLREQSPGLLDKFSKPAGTWLSAGGEQTSDAVRTATGFALPFRAGAGDSIVAQDASYPLYTWKQQGKDTVNWFYPAARLITGFAAQPAKLPLDLVPTGKDGQFKLVFKDVPKPRTKVTLVTQSGWSKEAQTDDHGLVSFEMPWTGTYVAEASLNESTPGQRGTETYDAVSYAITVTYMRAEGLPPIPAGAAGTPSLLK